MLESTLPPRLLERARLVAGTEFSASGRFVLYWVHHALRAHENPALDTALVFASRLGLPLLVVQELLESDAYACDRFHTFQLQAAPEFHAELARRRIASVLHVERRTARGSLVRSLSSDAALVVTDDLPTPPIDLAVERLAESTHAPIIRIDTSCIVPMRLVGKAHDRAFAYRTATRRLLEARIDLPWEEQPDPEVSSGIPEMPVDPLDPAALVIGELLAECDIDHSIAPVPHTLGGSAAGYARWSEFKDERIRRYADDRNDALRDGVSRMSAYLHYGMVSPFRIAREASRIRGAGAEKYLDELLIWRELAHAFCFHRPDHESIGAIPAWAKDSLDRRVDDPRPMLIDDETLARGRSGDPLWDAAQLSLLIQGELHNNVRMTWGKAVLHWKPDAERALRSIIDLNHRYALDGRDPSSSGGLLWCLGQFDRPHSPPQPILGTVRSRPTRVHAQRLDTARYLAWTTRPLRDPMPSVAIIGAGIAGITAARTLSDHGFDVSVFDKGRGTGGRIATRRVDADLTFDHGAQYFTARHPTFRRAVEAWVEQGVVADWAGRIVRLDRGTATDCSPQRRFVGVPGMSALPGRLAIDLAIRRETRVARLERLGSDWELFDLEGGSLGRFDRLIIAVPGPQASELLADHPLARECGRTSMTPCWAVMVAFEERFDVAWDGAFVQDSSIAWAARDSSKPGRPSRIDRWVLHASPEWSTKHLESTQEQVALDLLESLEAACDRVLPRPAMQAAHRWRFSQGADASDRRTLFDSESGLVVCGDWLAQGRIEGAFLSGNAAAGHLLREVGIPRG
ncbi:MAG: FAD-dependent oxidoreductase [Isosphaeraceae bacterium]|nr:FAD-dependent oxidoreductase [Isosphaeraceae bacterium]